MRRFFLIGVLGLTAAFWSVSCQGPDELFRNAPPMSGAAGTIVPTGGVGGGVTGVAGRTGTAGTTGVAGTSGVAGTTGVAGSAGGRAGTAGGAGAGGTGNRAGTSGGAGAGGGGRAGTSGGAGAAGTTGVAGTTGMAGAGAGGSAGGSTGTGKNCVDTIKINGYSAPGAQPCSACKDNQTDQSAACEALITCLDNMYPCSGNCASQCNNMAGASGVVQGCVSSLLMAASCS